MRQGNNASFIYSESPTALIGINLGSDYCAEHEWGIKDIQHYTGMNTDQSNVGLDRRKVNKVQNLHWVDNDKFVGFVLYRFFDDEIKNWKPRESYHSDKKKEIYCGWSKDGFYVLTDKVAKPTKNQTKVIERLQKVYDALNSNNACIWLGG